MPPPTTRIDPWRDLFLPARRGERRAAERALVHLPSDPAAQVLAVRALAALGRVGEAHLLWRRVRGERVVAVAALAVLLEDAPATWLARLDGWGPDPALRAAVWCDRAARALVDGERRTARAAIAEAIRSGPPPEEASVWANFLAEPGDPVSTYRALLVGPAARGFRPGLAPIAVRARLGWISEQRLRAQPSGSAVPAAGDPSASGGCPVGSPWG